MAQLYKADGTIEDFPPPANGPYYSLEEMRAAIGGGYIEIVTLADGRYLIVDDEGKLKRFPRNEAATELARGRLFFADDYICGDALVCDASQIE